MIPFFSAPPLCNVDLANMDVLTHLTLRFGCGFPLEKISLPRLAWIFLKDTRSLCVLKSIELVFGWEEDSLNWTEVFETQQIDEEDDDGRVYDYHSNPSKTDNMEGWEMSDDELDVGASAHAKGKYRQHVGFESSEACSEGSAVIMISDEESETSGGSDEESDTDESETSGESGEENPASGSTSKDNLPDYWRLLDEVLASRNFGNVTNAVVRLQFGDNKLFNQYYVIQDEPEIDSDDELVQPWLAVRLSDDEKKARWKWLSRDVEWNLREKFSSLSELIGFDNFDFKVEPFRGFSEYHR